MMLITLRGYWWQREWCRIKLSCVFCASIAPLLFDGRLEPVMMQYDQATLRVLRQDFTNHFDEEGLKTLSFDLGVDYDSLPATGKEGKARELVKYFQLRNRLPELVEHSRLARPDIEWPTLAPEV